MKALYITFAENQKVLTVKFISGKNTIVHNFEMRGYATYDHNSSISVNEYGHMSASAYGMSRNFYDEHKQAISTVAMYIQSGLTSEAIEMMIEFLNEIQDQPQYLADVTSLNWIPKIQNLFAMDRSVPVQADNYLD
jgi:hypothetical protein